jgi:hypothetical protein
LSEGPIPTVPLILPAKKQAGHIAWWIGGAFLLICALAIALWWGPRLGRQQKAAAANQVLEQAGRRAFREALAGVKVACEGATFEEFRQRQLALDSAFETYRADLKIKTPTGLLPLTSASYQDLHDLMWACKECWRFHLRHELLPLPTGGDEWRAMQIITPSVREKVAFTYVQRERDRDFFAKNYVTHGLTEINVQCESILSLLPNP